MLTDKQKTLLLAIARRSLSATAGGSGEQPQLPQVSDVAYGGVFVTLRRNRRLRGCIGTFKPQPNLVAAVWAAAAAAARDPRFAAQPVTFQEVGDLDLEISLLSALRAVNDPLSLEVGRHGVLIESPQGQGCFLPQVATEFGWDKREFLARCCRDKARLPDDAWSDPRTTVYLFTAETFSDGASDR